MLRNFIRRFNCPKCGRAFRCECGWIIAAVGVAVAVIGATYSAVSASEAQAQQNSVAKKNMQMQAEAEKAAGEARSSQIAYDAAKRQHSFLSSAAASGIDIASPSLLESETQFAKDENYSQQLAKYPHQLAGTADQYQSDLYGFASKKAASSAGIKGGVAGGSTLATGAANAYSRGLFNSGNNTGYYAGAE
jgi:hypothetical protein